MGKWVTSPESLSLITWAPNHFSLYSGAVRTSPSSSVGVLFAALSCLVPFRLSPLVSSVLGVVPSCVYTKISLKQCVCVLCLLDYYTIYLLFCFLLDYHWHTSSPSHVLCSFKCHVNFIITMTFFVITWIPVPDLINNACCRSRLNFAKRK